MRKAFLASTLVLAFTAGTASAATIVETAQSAGNFKTLLAAAEAAGLVGALSGPGPITVFAPTDEAFAKLPAGTVEDLLKPENKDKLAAILSYHVIPGALTADKVPMEKTAVETLKTSGDKTIDVQRSADGVTVDTAKVVTADISASNGVIHVIDSVILPTN